MSSTPKFSGGLFDMIQTGLNVGLPLALGAIKKPKAPKGCTLSNVFTQGEVALCLDQVWAEWQQLSNGLSAADRKTTAQAILTILNDPAKWRTPLETPEATKYFTDTKAFFEGEAAAVVPVNPVTGNIAGSQTGLQTTNPVVNIPVVGQIDQRILIYGAGAVILALVLTRGK